MFKKFFNWIKSIPNKIMNLKLAEFRKRKNIYYVPKDFHTNPKYRTFDELHPVNNNKTISDKLNEFIMKSEFNRNVIRALLVIVGITIYHGTRKVK